MSETRSAESDKHQNPTDKEEWVVITGCSSGIGLDCADRLLALNYQVIATVRKESDQARLFNQGFKHVLVFDLSVAEEVDAASSQIGTITKGKLKAVFNNAAYGQAGAVEDLDRTTLERQFAVNVFGTHQLTRNLLPYLRAHGKGVIIQNSSVLGFCAMPLRGAYNASKFALEGLSDTLRLELMRNNDSVRIALIEPGPITSQFRTNSLKALKENVNISGSRYAKTYSEAIARLSKPGPASSFTLPASAVSDRVVEILNVRHPRRRYFVTAPTYVFAWLRRVLPTFILDRLLIKAGS